MVAIFFVPGMFGSTVEFVLRSYTDKFSRVDGEVLSDGSMHSFGKAFHPTDVESITIASVADIATPIYPFKTHHFPEILQVFLHNQLMHDGIILYADSLRSAEINLLFQYHKIAFGKKLNSGLDLFCNSNTHDFTNWNQNYTHWKHMQPWELREWFSLFYVPWTQEWIESQHQAPNTFLKVCNTDVLYDTKNTFKRIFKFLNLTEIGDIDLFITNWTKKQQYIVDEFNLLDRIVECSITNQPLEWNPVNIVAEAIVQQRLREKGYEIQCDGLDIFPTDAIMFNTLLEKVRQ